MFLFVVPYYHAFIEIGPKRASWPLPNDFANSLPTYAAPRVPIILFLFVFTLLWIVDNAPERLPAKADLIAVSTPAKEARLRAAPVSIADMVKLFFLLTDRLRRLTMLYPFMGSYLYLMVSI